ncbi:16S rRNA (uracil(1498)-N(3))-methyltransferase [Frisingicoccus sp.]|uniref:16S rRNA (uracil(1498)-N(3))-methyltransferase n=1 Tax=Frisingicoccus sp. TaxID=1918627 RepID=UPI003AB4453C
MPRFFVNPSQVREDSIIIQGNDVNHIRNVLRMRPGDELSLSDGQGTDYFCRIQSMERDEICLSIENSWKSYVELPVRLYLFQGLPKGEKMELIIQKAVELGAYEIIPVRTNRAIVKLDAKKEVKKIARWQQIAESGAKQSGRGMIPAVKPVMGLAEALAYAKSLDGILIPYEKAEGIKKTREIIAGLKGKKSVGIFIGPEGGFDEAEVEAAMAAGAVPVTLGRRILRTETAGLTMLSILMFEFEEE